MGIMKDTYERAEGYMVFIHTEVDNLLYKIYQTTKTTYIAAHTLQRER